MCSIVAVIVVVPLAVAVSVIVTVMVMVTVTKFDNTTKQPPLRSVDAIP